MTIAFTDILSARRAIADLADHTPFVPAMNVAGALGQDFLIKLESAQPSGGCVLRGVVNALAGLPPYAGGVACCHSGGIAQAVAYAAQARGIRAVLFLQQPEQDDAAEQLRRLGVEVWQSSESRHEMECACQKLCASEHLVEIGAGVSPAMIAGQGTIGLEMLESRPDLDMILVPLEQNGLATGVAVAAKAAKPSIRLIGIGVDAMAGQGNVATGEKAPSLDDYLAQPLCGDMLDQIVLVSAAEVKTAQRAFYFDEGIVSDCAGSIGLAAAMAGKLPAPRGAVATILTARPADMSAFTRIVTEAEIEAQPASRTDSPHAA